MFKYQIRGITNGRKPMVIALTHFSDVAQLIADIAPKALDPTGEKGMRVEVVYRPEADNFIKPPRRTEDE